eukprot:TRINITY_DN3765_c2_g1_i2.p1 TRINITY_DN3765_c2_g1~~TRINITY_DN3765_c2_g1_i2.p1  ORF type:complete len:576 (+),score=184.15 TRINITY_DN3765_c2_g1_i2:99-1826(+)
MQRLPEPADPADARDWRRITSDRPTLGTFPKPELQGWALKLSTSVVSPWDKRWFVFCGSFICYFPSHEPTSKCSGCYYMPGMIVERLAEIPNHPSAPVHFNSFKENCVLFRPCVPRKPGGEYKDLILSMPDEHQLKKWEAHVAAIARTGSGPSSHSPRAAPPQARHPPAVAPSSPGGMQAPRMGSPTAAGPGSPGRGGYGAAPAKQATPEFSSVHQAMLKFSGISAEEAANHSEAVMRVLHFAEKHQADMMHPSRADAAAHAQGSASSPPPLPPGAAVPKKEKYRLDELVSTDSAVALYTSLHKLDSGSQGEVYRATRKADGMEVALKKIFIKNERKEIPALENEISMMYTSRHKNVVSFYSAHRNDDTLWIAMELMNGGKLTDLVDAQEVHFNEDHIAYIIKNTIEGVAYLHSMGRIHRDIKSDNILLNAKGEVKLGDFGFCAALSEGEGQKRKTVVGTPYWMAPEVIRGEPYDYKADVWSTGILALELLDGEPPLMDLPPMRALYVIVTQPAPKVKQPERWSRTSRHFIESMLQKDPAQRPNAWDLLQHPFLKKAPASGGFMEKMLRDMKSSQ